MIIIETSPFIRAMQTAAWIGHELGVKDFKVNYQISENITDTEPGSKELDWHFKENPMPNLEFTRYNYDFS